MLFKFCLLYYFILKHEVNAQLSPNPVVVNAGNYCPDTDAAYIDFGGAG